jgi:NAD(P)-dependent dehydrogenase (short-subunit alcohol dehydrogenase family)
MSVLFLTGASGALGSSIRSVFLERGWALAGFTHETEAFQHDQYKSFVMDASSEDSTSTAFDQAVKVVGTPDLIVGTVGGVRSWKTIQETSFEDAEALIRLNYMTGFLTIKHGIRVMEGNGGSIVLIGADTALKPGPRRGAYSSSKAALLHLTQVAAEEGKEIGVCVNCLVPNIIRTAANEEWGTPEEIEKWTNPWAIAETCLFLASSAGRQINGAILRIPNKV